MFFLIKYANTFFFSFIFSFLSFSLTREEEKSLPFFFFLYSIVIAFSPKLSNIVIYKNIISKFFILIF